MAETSTPSFWSTGRLPYPPALPRTTGREPIAPLCRGRGLALILTLIRWVLELGAGPNPNPNWCCSPGLATVLMWTFRGELTRVFLLCCGAFTIQFLAPLEVQVKLIEFIIKEYMHAQVRFQKTEIRHAGLPRA